MSLKDEAIRLRRKDWTDSTQELALELYLMFLQDVGATTAPAPPPTGGTGGVPVGSVDSPFPPIIPPDDTTPGSDGSTNPDQQDTPDGDTTDRTTQQKTWERMLVPGTVDSGSGNTYSCTLYPDGPSGEKYSKPVTATQMGIAETATIPAGSWAWVYRAALKTTTVTQTINNKSGQVTKTKTATAYETETYTLIVPVWM